MPSEELTLQSVSDRLRALEERAAAVAVPAPPPAARAQRAAGEGEDARSAISVRARAPARAADIGAETPAGRRRRGGAAVPDADQTRRDVARSWSARSASGRPRPSPPAARDDRRCERRRRAGVRHQEALLGEPKEPATSALIADAIGEVSGSAGPSIVFVAGSEADAHQAAAKHGLSRRVSRSAESVSCSNDLQRLFRIHR